MHVHSNPFEGRGWIFIVDVLVIKGWNIKMVIKGEKETVLGRRGLDSIVFGF
jgi:hypothetical protein